jgi:hypothetical protein
MTPAISMSCDSFADSASVTEGIQRSSSYAQGRECLTEKPHRAVLLGVLRRGAAVGSPDRIVLVLRALRLCPRIARGVLLVVPGRATWCYIVDRRMTARELVCPVAVSRRERIVAIATVRRAARSRR